MPRFLKTIATFAFLLGLFPATLTGQGAEDVLRYSLQYPSFDAKSMVLPGVSNPSGFGSYQENPAVMALFDRSFGSFSFSLRNVNEETSFLGASNTFDDTQSGVGDIGLVYRIPTLRGSLVMGGGYSQSTDYNRAMSLDIRNNRSSLTDFYNITEDDDLYDAAFNVYAVDWADVDSTFTQSIFRIGYTPSEFPGVSQDMELTERGINGDYSVFVATEFQKNLFVGGSIGIQTGNYKYERQFLETDPDNIYNGTFIDSDSDGIGETDIDRILSIDTIDATFTAFSARVGAVYRLGPFLQIGGSYQFASSLAVDEEYNTRLVSTFDNGAGFEESLPGEFSYKIKRPARANLGLSFGVPGGATLSASVERVDYSTAEIDLEGSDIDYQNDENEFISREFKETLNLRAGIQFEIAENFIPRVGYGYFPSPRESFDATREFFSGGFSVRLSPNTWFDLGAQYATWNDQNRLYTWFSESGSEFRDEIAGEQVRRLHVIGGIRIAF